MGSGPTLELLYAELNFDGTFESVTLTFGYDDSGCCLPFFNEHSLVGTNLPEQ